jgi:hypothetical protein
MIYDGFSKYGLISQAVNGFTQPVSGRSRRDLKGVSAGGCVSVRYATHLLRKLPDELGLKDVSGWRVCRHIYVSRAACAGIPPAYACDALGHKEFDMTFYYSDAGREDLLLSPPWFIRHSNERRRKCLIESTHPGRILCLYSAQAPD